MPAVQFRDYYEILGVPRTSDEKTLRSTFRKLARTHHPDVNPGNADAEERFKAINEAYEVLSDPAKRKIYDRYGEEWQRYRDAGFTGDEPPGRSAAAPTDFGTWFTGRQRAGADAAQDWTVFEVNPDEPGGQGFSDFFQTMFGGRAGAPGGRTRRGGRAPSMRGEDLEADVRVSFDEAFQGTVRNLQLQSPQTCPTCQGTGIARGATCPTCDGTGVTSRLKTLEVRVPKGVATGSRVRIAGQGGPGHNGGANGDVYLRISVTNDPRFERDGDDLRTDIDVPLYLALLGGEVVVPTPSGRVALRIPPETQPGRVFRLRDQGMPKLKGAGRGDLLAKIRVSLPTNLTDKERDLILQLKALREEQR